MTKLTIRLVSLNFDAWKYSFQYFLCLYYEYKCSQELFFTSFCKKHFLSGEMEDKEKKFIHGLLLDPPLF